MKTVNRKKLVTLAVTSALGGAAMLSTPAQAVNVSQSGTGQVLLFPYYTVKNDFNTNIYVTNTSDRTAIAKVRFREALNSREVRDFNIILSPHDMWTGTVTINGSSGAKVKTYDHTCTAPMVEGDGDTGWKVNDDGSKEINFTNIAYTGDAEGTFADSGPTSLTRTQEGYIEVILMATSHYPESSSTALADILASFPTTTISYDAQHVAGTPRDCGAIADDFDALSFGTAAPSTGRWAEFGGPANILMGNSTLINVPAGMSFDAPATALEDWLVSDVNTPTVTSEIIYAGGDLSPDLSNGGDTGANTALTANALHSGVSVTEQFLAAQDAVTAVLMAQNVYNEFVADTASGLATDWVVTFPTKHFYVDVENTSTSTATAYAPFRYTFQGDADGNGVSCDEYTVTYYNREELRYTTVGSSQFSPRPRTGSSNPEFCYEVNVLTFNNTQVFGGGSNHTSVTTTGVGAAGWASINLTETNGESFSTIFTGLPTIGFSAITRNNASDGNNNRNYGDSIGHTYIRSTAAGLPAAWN